MFNGELFDDEIRDLYKEYVALIGDLSKSRAMRIRDSFPSTSTPQLEDDSYYHFGLSIEIGSTPKDLPADEKEK